MASTAAVASGVTTRCAWPGRGESLTELMPFMNFLVHSYTCCSDRHASPYRTFIVDEFRWVSPLHYLKNGWQNAFFFGACCKRCRHLYTATAPSYCIPVSYCHLSATLQIMSIIVVNLQENRTVFRIFIVLFRFSFDSPSYIDISLTRSLLSCGKWNILANGKIYNAGQVSYCASAPYTTERNCMTLPVMRLLLGAFAKLRKVTI